MLEDPCSKPGMGARETNAGQVHEARQRWDTIYQQWGDLWPQNLMPGFKTVSLLYWFPHATTRKHSTWCLQTLGACGLIFPEVNVRNNVIEGLVLLKCPGDSQEASFLLSSGGRASAHHL